MKWSNLWPYTKNQSWLVEPESQVLVNSTFCAGIFCNFSSEVLPYGRTITQYISRCNYLPWHQPIPPITYAEDWFKHVLSSEPSCSHQFWIQSPWCQWSSTRGSCTTGGTSAPRQEVKRNKYVYIYIYVSTYWISCHTWTLHSLQQAEESRWELTGKWLKKLHINRSSSSAYCVFLQCNLQKPCLKVQFGEKVDFWASFPVDALGWRPAQSFWRV